MSQAQTGNDPGNGPGNGPGIATRVEGAAGVIQLDRPKALNALDQPMIDALAEALVDVWQKLGLPLKQHSLAAE